MYIAWASFRNIKTRNGFWQLPLKEDADRKVDFNDSIKFSYFYFEATLECFLCTEHMKMGVTRFVERTLFACAETCVSC